MTTILTGTSVSLFGIRENLRGLNEVAQDVAHASVDRDQLPAMAVNAVRQLEYTNAIRANAEAIKRSDEALGSLLDVLA